MAQLVLGDGSPYPPRPGSGRPRHSSAVLLAVLVAVVLAACGGGGPQPDIEVSPAGGVIISEVAFGDYIVLTNTSDTTVNLADHWLCNRPAYLELAGELEPGESVQISGAPLQGLNPAGGELGLYIVNAFNDPRALLDYVTWGDPGPSLTVAVAAGLWTPGDSIQGTGRRIIRTDRDGTGATGWTVTD